MDKVARFSSIFCSLHSVDVSGSISVSSSTFSSSCGSGGVEWGSEFYFFFCSYRIFLVVASLDVGICFGVIRV